MIHYLICFSAKSPAIGSLYISPWYALNINNNQRINAANPINHDNIHPRNGIIPKTIDITKRAKKVTIDCIA